MTMNEFNFTTVTIISLAFFAGATLGIFYFIGLWQTVKKIPASEHPVRLMAGSFVLRAVILLAALYFIMDGHWERMAAAMIGFAAVKILLMRKLGLKEAV
ncbi:MAG: ATP synthase subunit I [Smithellaceae bacterium]|jgi:F1F0 ATPase subunit 2|nr:ATP synthase subunit I [Smithellaceae bacterium]